MSDSTSEGFVPQPVADLPDVPGAVSNRPEVLAARAAAVEAREGMASEIAQLRRSTRATFDIKARLRRIPEAAREDPAKAAAIGAAGIGMLTGMVALVRRARRPRAFGVLPEDVDKVISGLGPEGEKVRQSLESGFAAYLREYGAQVPQRRRRVPLAIQLFVLPVAATVAREMIKRVAAAPATGASWLDRSRAGRDQDR